MKEKGLTRNILKYTALFCMLLDHIAITFSAVFPIWLVYVFRALGRISFPIFSYFVAQGYFYTHSKIKYVLTILVVALISQIPYFYLFKEQVFRFNILFSYLISILIMYLYDNYFVGNKTIYKVCFMALLLLSLLSVYSLKNIIAISHGVLGILLTFMFYVFLNSKTKQFVLYLILLIIQFAYFVVLGGINYHYTYINLFGIFSFVLIYFYNPQQKTNTSKIHKYVFYIFFPVHLLILLILKILIC